MTRAVSVVIPALDDRELLERNLPRLVEVLAARGAGDEVLVVDDTGEVVLEDWLAERFPDVRVVSSAENRGFARALLAGVEAARHELVFSMNPDVSVHAGFLDPLVAALDDPDVHSATPRVLLNGDPATVESVTEIRMRDDVGEVRQRGLEGEARRFSEGTFAVAYAIGGTCLLRRDEFLAQGGFDPLYEPFYWEDVDLGWSAWRAGRRVLYVAESVVEHHHRGTIGKRVDRDLVRAAIEKNRLLFQWKLLDGPDRLAEHVAALYRMAIDAWLEDRRETLVWLALALEQVDEAARARAKLPPAKRTFEEILAASDPAATAGA